MPTRASLRFVAATNPITELRTKFGGQPVWLGAPRWPLDAWNDAPMLFIGQIVMDAAMFGALGGRVVYVFQRDNSDDDDALGESDAGLTAAIVQSDGEASAQPNDPPAEAYRCSDQATGPSIFALDDDNECQPVEFNVTSQLQQEPDLGTAERHCDATLDRDDGYEFGPISAAFAGNKLGGQPLYPDPLNQAADDAGWRLVLQLGPRSGYYRPDFTPNFLPFFAEWGEFGVLHVLITEGGDRARVEIRTP
jgi:hypothetical protein